MNRLFDFSVPKEPNQGMDYGRKQNMDSWFDIICPLLCQYDMQGIGGKGTRTNENLSLHDYEKWSLQKLDIAKFGGHLTKIITPNLGYHDIIQGKTAPLYVNTHYLQGFHISEIFDTMAKRQLPNINGRSDVTSWIKETSPSDKEIIHRICEHAFSNNLHYLIVLGPALPNKRFIIFGKFNEVPLKYFKCRERNIRGDRLGIHLDYFEGTRNSNSYIKGYEKQALPKIKEYVYKYYQSQKPTNE